MIEPTSLRRVALRHDPASAVEARRAVSAALRTLPVTEAMVDTVALLTSELVTNAVLHGCAALVVTTLADATRVRVEVADGSPVMPKARRPRPDGTTGRGLLLVASLASRWGTDRLALTDLRKVVWFELDRRVDPAPERRADRPQPFDWDSVEPI